MFGASGAGPIAADALYRITESLRAFLTLIHVGIVFSPPPSRAQRPSPMQRGRNLAETLAKSPVSEAARGVLRARVFEELYAALSSGLQSFVSVVGKAAPGKGGAATVSATKMAISAEVFGLLSEPTGFGFCDAVPLRSASASALPSVGSTGSAPSLPSPAPASPSPSTPGSFPASASTLLLPGTDGKRNQALLRARCAQVGAGWAAAVAAEWDPAKEKQFSELLAAFFDSRGEDDDKGEKPPAAPAGAAAGSFLSMAAAKLASSSSSSSLSSSAGPNPAVNTFVSAVAFGLASGSLGDAQVQAIFAKVIEDNQSPQVQRGLVAGGDSAAWVILRAECPLLASIKAKPLASPRNSPLRTMKPPENI